jgi:hypothetical protein
MTQSSLDPKGLVNIDNNALKRKVEDVRDGDNGTSKKKMRKRLCIQSSRILSESTDPYEDCTVSLLPFNSC